MKKIFEYGLVAISIVAITLLVLKFKSSNSSLQNDFNTLSLDFNYFKSEKADLVNIYLNANNVIPEDMLLEVSESDGNDKYLLAYFNHNNCGMCVKQLLLDLERFASKNGFTRIKLAGDISEEKFFGMLGGKKSDDFKYFFVERNDAMSDMFGSTPVLFVINNMTDIIQIFVPELQKEYIDNYYEDILPELLFK